MEALAGSLALLSAMALFVIAAIAGLARMASRSDVHQVSGTVRQEHSGTIRHDVAGSVEHTVRHVGSVRHVHQLDPHDRARLDRMAEQNELAALERDRLEYAELQRKLDVVELRRQAAQTRPRALDVRRIPPAIER